jgi:hypothetical protein
MFKLTTYVNLARACGIEAEIKVAETTAPVGFNDKVKPVSALPASIQTLQDALKTPGAIVKLGGEEYMLDEHMSEFARAQDWVREVVEKIKDTHPDLYVVEQDNIAKFSLVARGLIANTTVSKRDSICTNTSKKRFDPEVVRDYITIIKAGYNKAVAEGLITETSTSVRRGTGTGIFPYSRASEGGINDIAVILGVVGGELMRKGILTEKDMQSVWHYTHIPWNASIYGTRASAKKGNEIFLATGTANLSIGVVTKVAPAVRYISAPVKIVSNANKKDASDLLKSQMRCFFHALVPEEIHKLVKTWLSNGLQGESNDFKSFDLSFSGVLLDQLISAIYGKDAFKQHLIELESYAPLLGPRRSENSMATLFSNDRVVQASGVSHTTPLNNACSVLVTMNAAKLFFGRDYLARYGIDWAFLAWGDDQIVFDRDGAFRKFLADYKIDMGFTPTTEQGIVFLMRYYDEQISTGIMSRRIQSFFEPERPKTSYIVTRVAIASHADSIREHPLYDDWVSYMNGLLKRRNYTNGFDVEQCLRYAISDECKKDLEAYAAESIQRAAEVADLFQGSTQGLMSMLDPDDPLFKSVPHMLGLSDVTPRFSYDSSLAAAFDPKDFLALMEAWNAGTVAGDRSRAVRLAKQFFKIL